MKLVLKRLALLSVVVSLAGCAAAPSKIQPAMVSRVQYQEMSCPNLELAHKSEISKLETLTGEQISSRNWDIALNILIIPGFGALTGDNESEIAQSKGRMIAIQEEFAERCVADSESGEPDTAAPDIEIESDGTQPDDLESGTGRGD